MVSHRPRPAPRSLGGSTLTNYGLDMSGLLKLVKILPETKIESLRCAAAPRAFAFVSAPLTYLLSHHSILPLARSIGGNYIGDEGATALAAILKDTKITDLKCAAAPECSLSCQRPLTPLSSHLPSRPRSLKNNKLGPEGGAALATGLKGNSTLHSLE